MAVAFLNLEENQKALKALLGALADYAEADERITAFHQSQTQNKKEKSDGNRTAAA